MNTSATPTPAASAVRSAGWTKKLLVGAAVAGAMLGSAGIAMAATGGSGPLGGVRSSLGIGGGQIRTCVQAKAPVDRAAKRVAVKECLTAAGIDPTQLADAKGALKMLKGATHADLTVPKDGGGYEVVQVDRGTVSSASAASVSLLRADGPTVTVTMSPTTKLLGIDTVTSLATGAKVVVVSSGGTARTIAAPRG